jgi:hypothetical protein
MLAADDGGGLGVVYVLAIFAAYWVPSIIAFGRAHHNKVSILVVNLFLGWTFIGWVVALAMSVGHVDAPQRRTPA